MTHIKTAFFSLTLLLGACDSDGTDEPGERALVTAEAEAGPKGGWMMKLDADQDGAISLEEAKGHHIEAKFAELDSDGDGLLSRDELKAMKAMKGMKGKHAGKSPEERAAKMLAKFDSDGDGALSAAEVAGHHLADKFAAADSDSDGKLSRDELMAMKRQHGGKHGGKPFKDPAEHVAMMMAKLDLNSDGALSTEEAAGHPHLAEKFAAVDTNGDGKLSRDELIAFKASHHGDKHRGPPQQ